MVGTQVREHDRTMRAELAQQYPYAPPKESPHQLKMKVRCYLW
jgi:hypothetical protein